MAEPFIGEIRAFGFKFAPKNWALCNGQTIPMYQAFSLYSVIGTTFGGSSTSIGLPDLRGRAPIHPGKASGTTTNYLLGKSGGNQTAKLSMANMPNHNHQLSTVSSAGNSSDPTGKALAQGNTRSGKVTTPWPTYTDAEPDTTMSTLAIASGGKGKEHENRQPYLVMNFCIALQGMFPPRA